MVDALWLPRVASPDLWSEIIFPRSPNSTPKDKDINNSVINNNNTMRKIRLNQWSSLHNP